jgi:hypothetical protein
MRRVLSVLVLLLIVGACSLGASGAAGPTASSVAVHASDLPSGMQRCDLSGDINSYLKKIQTKDPSTYSTVKTQWDAAQKDGATAADIEFYTDSTAHCASLESNGSQVGNATYKLVVNLVFQFKDQVSAEKGYKTDSIFGFSASTLKGSQIPATEGTATGLGPNSIALAIAVSSQSFYIAVWQNKRFMVILGLLNIETGSNKNIALAENKRIG